MSKSLLLTGFLIFAALSVTGELFGQVDSGPDGGAAMDAESKPKEVESLFGLPGILRDDEASEVSADGGTAVDREESLPERYLSRAMPWVAPEYSRQEGALGWDSATFKVPPGMVKRVAFWKEIYSKYTTRQGVLHDPDQPHQVYDVIDFSAVGERSRARSRLVNQRKAKVAERFLRLSRIKSEKDLRDADDRRYLAFAYNGPLDDLFSASSKKLLEATRSRLRALGSKRRIRFQLGQKDKFILGIYYSGRYLREMEKKFREERLPIELTRLPFVESSFNIQARSRVGASGIWQFMPRTAKPGMMVNRDVDERNDPLTATRGAARLLRSNYEQLRSWPLALTAYNHGAAGIARAVKKTGTRDLSVIIEKYESRRFGFASSNFYACFLAALDVERNAKALLGDVKWSTEFDGAEVEVSTPLEWRDVVRFYDGESALAELQNPHFMKRVRTGKTKIPKRTFVRVPLSRRELAEEWAKGRVPTESLTARLQAIPIVLPQPRAAVATQDDISGKLGGLSEAAQAILPFFKEEVDIDSQSDGKATTPPTSKSIGPDGGPGL
ncbi:MAG: lytic transglycosylase domain-containing protein [Bdellovibrionaceae bacterium]|nr:lytic transglycosylase domain-containing protein [Pseudobdellovibrionaceae bacterium]